MDLATMMRKLGVGQAELINCMIVATHCLSLPSNTSSSTAAGSMVGAFTRCVSRVMGGNSARFALGVCKIPPLAPGSSGGGVVVDAVGRTSCVILFKWTVHTSVVSNRLGMRGA